MYQHIFTCLTIDSSKPRVSLTGVRIKTTNACTNIYLPVSQLTPVHRVSLTGVPIDTSKPRVSLTGVQIKTTNACTNIYLPVSQLTPVNTGYH